VSGGFSIEKQKTSEEIDKHDISEISDQIQKNKKKIGNILPKTISNPLKD
jgi:hypothetical protein